MKSFRGMAIITAVFIMFGLISIDAQEISAQTKEPIKIGVIVPLTGSAASGGKKILMGLEIAETEINQQGGVLGRSLKLIVEDDESRPEAGMSAVHKLIDVEKVPIIVGSHGSSVTIPTATYSNSKGVVQIGISSTAPALRKVGPYFFSTLATDEVMATDLVKFAMEDTGQKNFCILVMNDSFGVGYGEAMKKSIEFAGGKVLSEVRYEKDKTDFRAELQRLFAPKPPAILMVAWFEGARVIQKQAFEMGLYQTVKDSWYSPYINIAVESCIPETVEGRKGTRTVIGKGRRVDDFHAKYAKKVGDPKALAEMYTCLGYDSLWVGALGINMAGSMDSDKIKNALPKAFSQFKGMSGDDLSVDKDGIRINQIYARQVYRNGKLQDYEKK